jgi:hypothetical protein
MGNKLSLPNQPPQNASPPNVQLVSPRSWRQANGVSFSPSTKEKSFCNPGPKPKFERYVQRTRRNPATGQNENYQKRIDMVPLIIYLNEYNSNDTVKYGCNPTQYIKYENGHYCCVDPSQKATPQEMLDFINRSLEGFFDNIGFSSAPNAVTKNKHTQTIRQLEFLLNSRNSVMTSHPGLIDNLEVPPNIDENGGETPVTLDEWVARYKMTSPVLVDTHERTPDSEENTLISMRTEYKRDENGNLMRDSTRRLVPFYTKTKNGQYKFGGTKHKKRRNKLSKKKTRKNKQLKNRKN